MFNLKYNYFENSAEVNLRQQSRLKNTDEARNCFLEEIKQNELMSKKHEKVCTTLNYIEHILILTSTITGCILISAFSSLSSVIGLKIRAIAVGIKK